MELRQSPEYAIYMKAIGWFSEVSPTGVQAFVRRIIPGMSVMKIQRAPITEIEQAWVKAVARRYKAWGCYIEPRETEAELLTALPKEKWQELAKSLRMTVTKNGMLPSATRRVDLTLSQPELLNAMKPKTRYNIGLARRKNLRLQCINGSSLLDNPALFDQVVDLIQANAKRVGYWGTPKNWLQAQLKAFAGNALVVLVGKPLQTAACYWLTSDGIYYGPNGSTELGRKNMAPTYAVFAAVLEGKRRKKTYLDFDGISDQRCPNSRWEGYSRFKAGFGGYEKLYGFSGYCWWPLW